MRLREIVTRGAPQKRYGVKNDIATQIVRDFFANLRIALLDGEEFHLPGLGKMTMVTMRSKTCRDPKTGDVVTYSKRQRIRFRTSGALLRALRVK